MGAGSLERDDVRGGGISPRGYAPRALDMLTGTVTPGFARGRLPYSDEHPDRAM